MFEKNAEDRTEEKYSCNKKPIMPLEAIGYKKGWQDGAEFGYNKANEEHKEKCKTAYIKGIRTMANALKDYDRTEGVWTDYFEHTVEEVLKRLLKESK